MESVEPIRKQEDIDAMAYYFKNKNKRDYVLFYMGINVALRISDLLKLKVSDVKNKKIIRTKEMKTGKVREMPILPKLKQVLDEYCQDKDDEEYLFRGLNRKVNKPITRVQAYRILIAGAKECGLKNIGTHSFRKTFGYHFHKSINDVTILMKLFNHHDPSITLRYIGIDKDETQSAVKKFGGF